jgi:hypothetical protein
VKGDVALAVAHHRGVCDPLCLLDLSEKSARAVGPMISKKIQIQEGQRIFYGVRVKTEEEEHPADGLVVRLTDEAGKHLAAIESQTDAATQRAGEDGWVEDSVNLLRFARNTVRLSFLVKTNKERTTTFYMDSVALR